MKHRYRVYTCGCVVRIDCEPPAIVGRMLPEVQATQDMPECDRVEILQRMTLMSCLLIASKRKPCTYHYFPE